MNVLFFKVEDTLNFPETEARSPTGRLGIVDKQVKAMHENLKTMEPGTQLVLFGDWAKDWNFDNSLCTSDGKYLNRKLERRGLHIMAKVENESITEYVKRKHVDNYKVLTDVDGLYE